MKYTLQENAMSSFHLAIENFKKFFYMSNSYKHSELDEARKMCAIFLENAIELFLKALLVKNDDTSIYEQPDSSKIKKAKEVALERNETLEDILVEEGNFKTITYKQTLDRFYEIHPSKRTKNIFLKISEYRNRLTHFGLTTDDDNEFEIVCINAFTVLYQNIYEMLVTLEKIEPYLTDEDVFVRTIHGWKNLFNDNDIYNNIIDFLDDLVFFDAPSICLFYRLNNEKYRINIWCSLLDETINSPNFQKMLDYYEVSVDWKDSDITQNKMYITLSDTSGVWDSLFSSYSSYDNATTIIGESNLIYFRVLHSSDELVIYYEGVDYPEYNMPQYEEDDWNEHLLLGDAKKFSLTKRNIKLAFETICKEMKNNRGNNDKANLQSSEASTSKSESDEWLKLLTEEFTKHLLNDQE